ncbi:MAG: arsenite methyltransferase [Vicinamibacteraceae bacterium]|nr:arsenite methyltransferase [Vicinamibacteraceae bacterium]
MTEEPLTEIIQARYGEVARRVRTGVSGGEGCCGPAPSSCCGTTSTLESGGCDPITRNLYSEGEAGALPAEAVAASLGCGNPTALATIQPGQTVLDLGSGGGIDVLLSARRVGPTGKVYGLDMTDEMLALARENQVRAGVTNVEFLKGHIEDIPLPDATVDLIISNCVINLSQDKGRVLREAFRVLKPGGRFAVSDIVLRGEMPEPVRRNVELWVGCVAGALQETDYRRLLGEAGFEAVEVEVWRVYDVRDARDLLASAGLDADALAPTVNGTIVSAFIRATRPAA